jgi:hypothetical protein
MYKCIHNYNRIAFLIYPSKSYLMFKKFGGNSRIVEDGRCAIPMAIMAFNKFAFRV